MLTPERGYRLAMSLLRARDLTVTFGGVHAVRMVASTPDVDTVLIFGDQLNRRIGAARYGRL